MFSSDVFFHSVSKMAAIDILKEMGILLQKHGVRGLYACLQTGALSKKYIKSAKYKNIFKSTMTDLHNVDFSGVKKWREIKTWS